HPQGFSPDRTWNKEKEGVNRFVRLGIVQGDFGHKYHAPRNAPGITHKEQTDQIHEEWQLRKVVDEVAEVGKKRIEHTVERAETHSKFSIVFHRLLTTEHTE